MKTTDSSIRAVRTPRTEHEQLVWTDYVKALQALDDTRCALRWARSSVEEALMEFEYQRQGGASEPILRALNHQIVLLQQQSQDAEIRAATAHRHANQALVSVLSAQEAAAALSQDRQIHKGRFPNRAVSLSSLISASNHLWN